MVVKLFFTDGSSSVRSFTDEELKDLKLLDKLINYFNEKLSPTHHIDSYELFDIKKCPVVYDIHKFDIVDYFNYSNSFIGLVVDGFVVERVEFFDRDSYEYGLDSLEGEPYERGVRFNYAYDHYHYSKLIEYWDEKKINFDFENWDK